MHIEIGRQSIGQSFAHVENGRQSIGQSFSVEAFLSPSPYGQSAGHLQGVGGRGEAKTVTPE